MDHIPLQGGFYGIVILGVSTCLAYMGLIVSTIYDTLEINYLNKTDHQTFMFVAGGTGLIDSLFFLVVPSFVTFFGAKISIIVSGCLSLSILLRNALKIKLANITFRIIDDFIWLLIMPPHGYYLINYSTSTTLARNAGIFWIFYSLSDLFANIAMYITLHEEDADRVIPDMTIVFWIYFGITFLGVLVMFFLPQPRVELLAEKINVRHRCAKSLIAFKRQLHLLSSSNILILSVTFIYIGMLSIFCEWVYEVALYHTYDMENQKKQSLLSGIVMATGGLLASLMISFIRGTVQLWGWNPIFVLGLLLQLVGFLFVFLNIPDTSPMVFTEEDALITTNPALSVICCALLGFGNACFITQTITLLGLYYVPDSIAVFSIYKFFQSIGMFVSMFYIFQVGIYIQLGILIPFALAGTGAFLLVDWRLSQELDLI